MVTGKQSQGDEMTPEQQRETALRLYRLAWRFPERAPSAMVRDFFEVSTAWELGTNHVYVRCRKDGDCSMTVAVGNQEIHIIGTAGYVEAMLRSIPAELRPHVENTK